MAADQIVVGLWAEHDEVYVFDKALETFSTKTVPSAGQFYRICTDGFGTYIMLATDVDFHDSIARSTDDGDTWELIDRADFEDINTNNFNYVLWDGTQFVACPGGGTWIYTSPDAITWTKYQKVFGATTGGVVRFQGSYYLAHSTTGTGSISPDSPKYTGRMSDGGSWATLTGGGMTSITPPRTDNSGTFATHWMVSNDQRMVAFVGKFRDDVVAGTWESMVQSGSNGKMLCGAYNPDGDYWIGGGYDSDTYDALWGYSADGETWVKYTVAGEDPWTFMDCLFDGTNFWFAATPSVGAPSATAAALFKMEPTDPSTGTVTFTRYDLPGTTVGGAWTLAGPSRETGVWGEVDIVEIENVPGAANYIVSINAVEIEHHVIEVDGAGPAPVEPLPTGTSTASLVSVVGNYDTTAPDFLISYASLEPLPGDLLVAMISSNVAATLPDGFDLITSSIAGTSAYLYLCQRRITSADAEAGYPDISAVQPGSYAGWAAFLFRGPAAMVTAYESSKVEGGMSLSAPNLVAAGDVGMVTMHVAGTTVSSQTVTGHPQQIAHSKATSVVNQARSYKKTTYSGSVGSPCTWNYTASAYANVIVWAVDGIGYSDRVRTDGDVAAIGGSVPASVS